MSYFYRMPKRPDNPDIIEVTDHEFLTAWTESGGGEDAGRLHLDIAKRMGSSVAIGGRFYKPKPNNPDATITAEVIYETPHT